MQVRPVLLWVEAFQQGVDLAVHIHDDIHDDRGEEVDAEIYLVHHHLLVRTHGARLPQFFNFFQKLRFKRGLFPREQANALVLFHHPGDMAQLDEHFGALGFAGVGCQHEAQAQLFQQLANAADRHPFLAEVLKRVVNVF